MQVDESLAWGIRLAAPAFVCIVLGAGIQIVGLISHRLSRSGRRILMLGAALLFLVPGVFILGSVAAGVLLVPALFACAFSTVLGCLFLALLRSDWSGHTL